MCKYCEPSEKQLKKMRTTKGFDEWYEDYSMVEELQDECAINIPRSNIASTIESSVDEKFGLIGVIMLHKIPCEGVKRKKEMFTFLFAKKHIEKIRKIEKAYMSGEMQIDAKQMSMAFSSVLNSMMEASLIHVRPPITSIRKSKARSK